MAEATAPYVIPQEPVVSSNLAAIGYDLQRQVLAVTFKSGDVWHYASVPSALAEQLFEADSKGKFFSTHIKGKFSAEKMTGPCEKCGDKGPIGATCTDCGCGTYTRDERQPFKREFEPTRVLINEELEARSAPRAKAIGVVPDVIFVRDDGWSLGAPKRLEQAARSSWQGHWVERWERAGNGWRRTWPLPGETS